MTNRNDIEQLFKAHYAEMRRLSVALLHDDDLARDIVHDVFATLLDGDSILCSVRPYGLVFNTEHVFGAVNGNTRFLAKSLHIPRILTKFAMSLRIS